MIGYREAGQKERRSVGYLDVSMMTSKGPSGVYAVEWKEMSGNRGLRYIQKVERRFWVGIGNTEESLMEGGGGEGVARDFSIRKWFSRAVFMKQSFAVSGGRTAKSPASFLQLFFLFHLLMSSILKMSSFTWINTEKVKKQTFIYFWCVWHECFLLQFFIWE